jgi:hypothetical protein
MLLFAVFMSTPRDIVSIDHFSTLLGGGCFYHNPPPSSITGLAWETWEDRTLRDSKNPKRLILPYSTTGWYREKGEGEEEADEADLIYWYPPNFRLSKNWVASFGPEITDHQILEDLIDRCQIVEQLRGGGMTGHRREWDSRNEVMIDGGVVEEEVPWEIRRLEEELGRPHSRWAAEVGVSDHDGWHWNVLTQRRTLWVEKRKELGPYYVKPSAREVRLSE